MQPKFCALLLGTLVSASCAMAQDAAWNNSYQLEAAQKYIEAINALDFANASGSEQEFKSLRRAWLLYQSGKYDDAAREYRQAAERYPRSVDARLGQALALLGAKRWREAETVARGTLELAPNSYLALLRMVLAQEGAQDWAAMARSANQLVQAYNSDATAHLYLARAYAWLGRRTEAMAAYTAVLARNPSQAEAKAYVGAKS
ncbi:tetratricopeptide repeat protein [Curvibacter sp. APW13]|uniref:tetratricopeptide repeat protein n=1 Tax=Curvibacter sp. APW13 TaxID=3077236 RepID=UPI0028DFAAB8|nr:tetratricopeptide repeat protein [Curvibacter sp. APW13]MDT8991951.1 tetratricopeptide repeat protein [Curvibacter sp. APW13]